MLGTSFAGWVTTGIYKYLALILIGNLFKYIEFVVEVIVDNNDMIILFDLRIKRIGVGDFGSEGR